ncbi:MAG: hypothetical protein ACOCQR_03720 [bacterium]
MQDNFKVNDVLEITSEEIKDDELEVCAGEIGIVSCVNEKSKTLLLDLYYEEGEDFHRCECGCEDDEDDFWYVGTIEVRFDQVKYLQDEQRKIHLLQEKGISKNP